MKYKKYLKSNDWKRKRNLKRSKKLHCAICASTENIDIHHLNYKNLYNVEQSDLRKLCRRCHGLTHKLFKEGKIKFRSNNHHSRFVIIKSAVKKYLGISAINCFAEAVQKPSDTLEGGKKSLLLHITDRPTDGNAAKSPFLKTL